MRDKSYFISDLHLGAGYIDDPRGHENKIVAWLESISPTARHLFLLGDVLDYWYEYKNVVPRGFIRFFGALAKLADSGTEIVWLKGNHDIWLFDYLSTEIGLTVVDGTYTREIDGKRFLMEHGDGVGNIAPMYGIMRKTFRNRFCQKLYAAIHPRWTIAFANGWSSHSRKSAPEVNEATVRNDIERLTEYAESHNRENNQPADYFVFGHLHVPTTIALTEPEASLIVLGDAYRTFSYGEWDGHNFRLKTMF